VHASRVLQLGKYHPPVAGGIETVARELTLGLNRAGVATDVLCADLSRRTVVEHADTGYRIVRAGRWGRLLSTAIAPSMVTAMHEARDEYDLVHAHMPDPMAALALLATRPKARLVLHWHSDVVRQRVAMRAYRPLQDWVLRRADAIVATSQAYADSSEALRRWRDKVAVIPIGVSDSRDRVRPEQVSAIRARYAGRRIVFSLGRMTHYKGFKVLARAAAMLPDDCVVLIGGDGIELDGLRRFVSQQRLGDRVHVLGHIGGDMLPAYYEACDVFCLPSTMRAEAFGVSIVEALLMGKPVVATDIPGSGVPWVNRHGVTGLNAPAGNAEALAVALGALTCNPKLRLRMGEAARRRYLEEFGVDRMVARTLRLYESLGLPPAPFPPAEPGSGSDPETGAGPDTVPLGARHDSALAA
jgi:rhamnosyl/mannosyltransferase